DGARASPAARTRRLLAQLAAERLRQTVMQDARPDIDMICEALLVGKIDFETAVLRAIRLAAKRRI
ncbi:MAG TPA: hypothetical protein VEU47_07420, partial [Candidatus Cybelea sp.]|nr:hypothetical protein [Candidatus Cybelea sp.]